MIVAKKQFTINWFKTIFKKYIMSTLGIITNKVSSIGKRLSFTESINLKIDKKSFNLAKLFSFFQFFF